MGKCVPRCVSRRGKVQRPAYPGLERRLAATRLEAQRGDREHPAHQVGVEAQRAVVRRGEVGQRLLVNGPRAEQRVGCLLCQHRRRRAQPGRGGQGVVKRGGDNQGQLQCNYKARGLQLRVNGLRKIIRMVGTRLLTWYSGRASTG